MIKINFKFSILIVILLTVSSCEKEFLDTYSTTAVATSDVLLSTGNAIAALNGIHRNLYNQSGPNQGHAGEGRPD